MKLSEALNSLKNRLRHRLLSRLLFTYIAIMLVMLALQSLLMGGIYQQEYYAERVRTLQRDAADLALQASEEMSSSKGFSPYFVKTAAAVAKRQDAEVWIVDRIGSILQLQQVQSSSSGTTKVSELVVLEFWSDEFKHALTKVMRGEVFLDQGIYSGQYGANRLTVGVPIRYMDPTKKDVTIGAVFLHTKTETMVKAIGNMYRHIATSAAVSTILGIILVSLISTRISRPLVQMNGIAKNIARGVFDKKADVSSKDEIGQLAQSFNTMGEELKKQEDLRSGFVANVSHELRSPLTSIHGFAQGMLDGTIDQNDYQKYLGVIVGETRRLNKLIRELLDLSQIESGKFPLNLQTFDINVMISRVLITFEEKIDSKSLDIDVEYRQDKAFVLADPDRIEQVLINLLDNAVKFTPERGHIRVWTHGAADKILIGISDDGPGIPEEDQPFIWERFYKVDKSHTGKKGTGLGLSIVKKIMDQHGERISVQSKLGGGTVFVFCLKKPD